MRKLTAVLFAGALVVAACSTDPDEDESSGDTPATEAADDTPATDAAEDDTETTEVDDAPTTEAADEETVATEAAGDETETTDAAPTTTIEEDVVIESDDPRAPGVTADTIRIGVTYPDLEAVGISHGDYERAWQAVVDGLNAEGAFGPRNVELVFAPVDPLQSDAATAACTRLTQDEEVFLAAGFFQDDQVLCYVDTNETPVVGGSMSDERLARAKVAWFSVGGSDDQQADAIQALIDAGTLDGNFAVIGAADEQALYENELAPVLTAADLEPVVTAFADTSSGDQNAIFGNYDIILDRFEAEGVDQILAIGTASGPVLPNRVSARDFSPQLVFTDVGSVTAFVDQEGNDLSSLEGSVASGIFNSATEFDTLDDEATLECVGFLEAAGHTMIPLDEVPEGDERNAISGANACGTLYLLAEIFDRVGEPLDFGSFRIVGESLGELQLPMQPAPGTWGPPPSADGDIPGFLYEFDAAFGGYVARDA